MIINFLYAYLIAGFGFSLCAGASEFRELMRSHLNSSIRLILCIFFYPLVILIWILDSIFLLSGF